MAEGDISMAVARYTTSLGFRIHAVDNSRRVAPDHRIHLYARTGPGAAAHAQVEFDDTGGDTDAVGTFHPRDRFVELRLPVSEYDRTILLLRSGQPVNLVFNHFGDGDRHLITSATFTTGQEAQ